MAEPTEHPDLLKMMVVFLRFRVPRGLGLPVGGRGGGPAGNRLERGGRIPPPSPWAGSAG
jgi:hypothetical protein